MKGNGVELDWSDVTRGLRQLESGVDTGAKRAALTQAQQVAARIRNNVPVRTGALRASIDAVEVDGGAGVTYGAGLRYANPVAARTGAVRDGLDGVDMTFSDACEQVARREVSGL